MGPAPPPPRDDEHAHLPALPTESRGSRHRVAGDAPRTSGAASGRRARSPPSPTSCPTLRRRGGPEEIERWPRLPKSNGRDTRRWRRKSTTHTRTSSRNSTPWTRSGRRLRPLSTRRPRMRWRHSIEELDGHEAFAHCEGCSAPIFDGDAYASDPDEPIYFARTASSGGTSRPRPPSPPRSRSAGRGMSGASGLLQRDAAALGDSARRGWLCNRRIRWPKAQLRPPGCRSRFARWPEMRSKPTPP